MLLIILKFVHYSFSGRDNYLAHAVFSSFARDVRVLSEPGLHKTVVKLERQLRERDYQDHLRALVAVEVARLTAAQIPVPDVAAVPVLHVPEGAGAPPDVPDAEGR